MPPPASKQPKKPPGLKRDQPHGQTTIKWYYSLNGERLGPVTEEQMRELLSSGKLSNETQVWTDGFDDWRPISQTPLKVSTSSLPPLKTASDRQIKHTDRRIQQRIQSTPKAPPPLPGKAVSNTVIWIVAFVPIWGTFLARIISLQLAWSATEKAMFEWPFWLILNSALCWFDEQRLEKAGHNTSSFGFWFWLVPVYLYKRAKTLKQPVSYFVTWIVCWLLSCFL